MNRIWTLSASPWSLRAYQIVVAFSVVVRLLALYFVRNAPLASDAQDYSHMARQLVSGQAFVPYWPPGVALYLTPFVAAGAGDAVLRAAALPFWLLACWGLYRLMRATGTHGIAWLVLLVFSLLPDSIQMAVEPMTQMPVAALLILTLSAAVRVVRGAALGEYLLLGLSLGVMSLIRPSAIPLVVLVPAACFLASRRLAPSLASLALAVVLIGCWIAHAHALTGRWIINTANAGNLYYGNNPWTPVYRTWYFGSHAKLGSDEIAAFPEYEEVLQHVSQLPVLEQPAEFQRLTTSYVRSHPAMFLFRTANRIRCFFGFDTFTSAALSGTRWLGLPLFPVILAWEAFIYLLIAGTAVFWIARASKAFWRDATNWIILGAIVVYGAPYWISMSHPTYHFPILLPLAALGAHAWRVSREGSSGKVRGWVAVAVLGLVQVEWVWQMAQSIASRS